MTVFFELQALIAALRERQIALTRALERICNDQQIRAQTKDMIREPHSFDGEMPGWLAELLMTEGLSAAEIQHAGSWPADQKEALRAEISFAYDEGLPLSFGWDITREDQPTMEIHKERGGGTMIVFLSPRNALEHSGNAA